MDGEWRRDGSANGGPRAVGPFLSLRWPPAALVLIAAIAREFVAIMTNTLSCYALQAGKLALAAERSSSSSRPRPVRCRRSSSDHVDWIRKQA
jgi:hypothetical protein